MSYVRIVEGPPPLGIPVADPNLDLRNFQPYPPSSTQPYPGIIRRNVRYAADVTPSFLVGREQWSVLVGPSEAILERVQPPIDPTHIDDARYRRQTITEQQPGYIHTPADMINALNPTTILPGIPGVMRLTNFVASYLYFFPERRRNHQIEKPLPPSDDPLPTKEDEKDLVLV